MAVSLCAILNLNTMRKLFLIILMCISVSSFALTHVLKTGSDFAIPQAGIIYPHENYTSTSYPIGKITEIYKIDDKTVKVVAKMSAFSSSYTYYWTVNEVVPLYRMQNTYSSGPRCLFIIPPVLNKDNTPSYYIKVTSFKNNEITIEHGESL